MPPSLLKLDLVPPNAPIGVREPRLWVRRLLILKDLKTPLRDIHLKPGLNIIWTPDQSSSGKSALAHGSGKTTFCRLLRAALGEVNYATETGRERIFSKFPEGLFATEIMVDGVCWISVRPFGGSGGFVAQSDHIESVLDQADGRQAPSVLEDLISQTFFQGFLSSLPTEVDAKQVWTTLLAWLSRDQECRLADILDWRSSKTQTRSRAQTISESAKLTLVRLALRAINPEEVAAQAKERTLAKKNEQENNRRNVLAIESQRELADLRRDLNITDSEVGLEDTLQHKGLVSIAKQKFHDAMATEFPKPNNFVQLSTALEDLRESKERLNELKTELEKDAEKKRNEAMRKRSEAEQGVIDIAHGRIRVCPVCKVTIDKVLAEGCGISLEPCNIEQLRLDNQKKRKLADRLDAEADEIDTRVAEKTQEIANINKKIESLRQEIEGKEKEEEKIRRRQSLINEAILNARTLYDTARRLQKRTSTVENTEESSLPSQIETIRLKLERYRKDSFRVIYEFEQQYRSIMQAWLPDGTDGIIKLSGNGLKVDIELDGRGQVSTAALDSLKIVAFDLAVLHLATEGKASLPAFLIHDSPREADLDGSLYARLFEIIAEWEQTAAPCFQYIVTTTTAPPQRLQTDAFIRLKMSSTPATERLFRADL